MFEQKKGNKERIMKKSKKVLSGVLAATMVAGLAMGTSSAYARSSMRAAWNDASSSKTQGTLVKDACFAEDGSETDEHTVYSNVYADSEAWAQWQTEWASISRNYEQIALTPGKNATELNFAWYSLTSETPMVKLMDSTGKTIDVFNGTQDADKAETVVEGENSVTLYPNKVTVTGLDENTEYKYQYYYDGKWSDTFDYSTKSTESFSVMYVGDPQIGASTGQTAESGGTGKEYFAMNDAYNWKNTLSSALSANPDISFILSAGDQINQTSATKDADKLEQQIEYAGFLFPTELRSTPIATTIGNHDSKSVNYQNHFNNPNTATEAANLEGATTAGTDYYFRYGNTLFVSIDTNNYNCATHENVIKEAVENNEDATWRILMFHQDIYGSGYDHSDTDGMVLRTQLTPIIDEYDFDAVLQGHDHTYSRTYQISADGNEHTAYTSAPSTSSEDFETYLDENKCYDLTTGETDANKVIDPEGTVYFEANSSTGSKYYQLIGTQQDYVAARSQSWRPTYSIIEITDVTLTVKTYDAATNEELVADGGIATAYTIVKSADKTDLETAVEEALAKLNAAKESGKYTEASLQEAETLINAAQAILDNAEAGTKDIASAITSLAELESNLVETTATDEEPTDEEPTDEETTVEEPTDEETTDEELTDNNVSVDVNAGYSKKTAGMAIWFALAGASFIGLSVIISADRKRKRISNEK